jgi:hypothetical protein
MIQWMNQLVEEEDEDACRSCLEHRKNGVSSRNKSAAKGMTNSDHGQEAPWHEPSVIGRQEGITVAWPATRAECERERRLTRAGSECTLVDGLAGIIGHGGRCVWTGGEPRA